MELDESKSVYMNLNKLVLIMLQFSFKLILSFKFIILIFFISCYIISMYLHNLQFNCSDNCNTLVILLKTGFH